MSSIRQLLGNNTRSFRGGPLVKKLLRRGVSTQELDATKGDRERVVILGSGSVQVHLDIKLKLKLISKKLVWIRTLAGTRQEEISNGSGIPKILLRFHAAACVNRRGTLEFRTTLESVRARRTGVEFFQGWADDVDFNEKRLRIEEAVLRPSQLPPTREEAAVAQYEPKTRETQKGQMFDLKYDKLVVAVGCYSQTFGTPGVRENAFFLKDITDAREIRERVLECFETASLPTTSDKLRDQLLNFAIVGGGPTGIEFAAELFDLCHEDLRKLYPSLIPHITISIYDVAPKILPMFDHKLADYALNLFKRDGINIKTEHHIESLRPGLPGSPSNNGGAFTLTTRQEGEVGVGMCVWSTGLMMNPFIQKALDDVHTYPSSSAALSPPMASDPTDKKWALKRSRKSGGLMVDGHFRVKLVPRNGNPESPNTPEATMRDVFALGDVSVFEKGQLPATA